MTQYRAAAIQREQAVRPLPLASANSIPVEGTA
jgi:hypothetical protein